MSGLPVSLKCERCFNPSTPPKLTSIIANGATIPSTPGLSAPSLFKVIHSPKVFASHASNLEYTSGLALFQVLMDADGGQHQLSRFSDERNSINENWQNPFAHKFFQAFLLNTPKVCGEKNLKTIVRTIGIVERNNGSSSIDYRTAIARSAAASQPSSTIANFSNGHKPCVNTLQLFT